jgi:hypothetical protein
MEFFVYSIMLLDLLLDFVTFLPLSPFAQYENENLYWRLTGILLLPAFVGIWLLVSCCNLICVLIGVWLFIHLVLRKMKIHERENLG